MAFDPTFVPSDAPAVGALPERGDRGPLASRHHQAWRQWVLTAETPADLRVCLSAPWAARTLVHGESLPGIAARLAGCWDRALVEDVLRRAPEAAFGLVESNQHGAEVVAAVAEWVAGVIGAGRRDPRAAVARKVLERLAAQDRLTRSAPAVRQLMGLVRLGRDAIHLARTAGVAGRTGSGGRPPVPATSRALRRAALRCPDAEARTAEAYHHAVWVQHHAVAALLGSPSLPHRQLRRLAVLLRGEPFFQHALCFHPQADRRVWQVVGAIGPAAQPALARKLLVRHPTAFRDPALRRVVLTGLGDGAVNPAVLAGLLRGAPPDEAPALFARLIRHDRRAAVEAMPFMSDAAVATIPAEQLLPALAHARAEVREEAIRQVHRLKA